MRDLGDVMACGNGRATYVDQGKDNGSTPSIINMNIGYKSEKITDQGIPDSQAPSVSRVTYQARSDGHLTIGRTTRGGSVPGPLLGWKIRPGTN